MIIIHYDFVNGKELSYIEGRNKKDNFETNCLDFFTTYNEASDVVVLCKNGEYISRNELLANNGEYTDKEIRPAHNILNILKGNALKFKPPINIKKS